MKIVDHFYPPMMGQVMNTRFCSEKHVGILYHPTLLQKMIIVSTENGDSHEDNLPYVF